MTTIEKISDLRRRLEQVTAQMYSYGGADPSKEFVGGGDSAHCRFSDLVLKKIEIEEKLEAEIETYLEDIEEIKSIKAKRWRAVLRLKYINGNTNRQIAKSTGISIRQVQRIIKTTL